MHWPPMTKKTMYNFVVLPQPSETQVMLLTDDCYWSADRIDSARRQRACQHYGSPTEGKKKKHCSGHHICCSKQLSNQPHFFFLCTQNTLPQPRRDTKQVLCVKGHAVHISSVSTVYSGEQRTKKKGKAKSGTGAFVLLVSLPAS